MEMNNNQKVIVYIVIGIIIIMLLFPPFYLNAGLGEGKFIIRSDGYHFIIFADCDNCRVDAVMLLVQWLGVLIAGGLCFLASSGKKKE
jgi:hypothetical protein